MTKNVIFIHRAQGHRCDQSRAGAAIRRDRADPARLRIPFDMRKIEPYEIYDRFDFDVPTETAVRCRSALLVRCREMEQSCRIIEQALDQLPGGAYRNDKVPFKVKPPKGEVYFSFESARGQTGFYLVSDGTSYPYRLRVRVPSFGNLHVLVEVFKGALVADAVSILGSIDVVIPEIDR